MHGLKIATEFLTGTPWFLRKTFMTGVDYEGYDSWKGWSADDFGKCAPEIAHYFASELFRSGVKQLSGKAVLELGFGNGSFAGWARGKGASYIGTETIPSLVDAGREQGFEVHLDAKNLPALAAPDTLDFAVAFDVFEHLAITDLREWLRRLHVCLRPGGKLIVRVPSGDSPFARAIQHGDMTHRLILGSSAVRQLAAEAGFAVESIREPAFPLRGAGVLSFLKRLGVSAARAIAYPVIANVFMGGGAPVLTPNLLFVLQKPQGCGIRCDAEGVFPNV